MTPEERVDLDAQPADLDALRRWAEQWSHLDDRARQARHLFEEWDAANEAVAERDAEIARLRERVAGLELLLESFVGRLASDAEGARAETWRHPDIRLKRIALDFRTAIDALSATPEKEGQT